MNSSERYAMIVARVLIATMFLLNGLNIIGQSLAAHELAVYGAPATSQPYPNSRGACAATHRGQRPDPWDLSPHLCSRSFTVPDTGNHHGTFILAVDWYTAVPGSTNQLLEESVDGGWPDFRHSDKKSASLAATLESLTRRCRTDHAVLFALSPAVTS